MTPTPTEREIEKLRKASHEHANRITDHEGRIDRMETTVEKFDEISMRHEVALARGQKVMEQMGQTTEKMEKAGTAMAKSVVKLEHSFSMFGKFHIFLVFPVLVSVFATAIWAFLSR